MEDVQYKLIEAITKGATEATIDAGKDLVKEAATSAYRGLKSLLGFGNDAKAEEIKALVDKSAASDPHRAEQIAQILNDYRTQIAATQGGVAGRDYIDNRGANFDIHGGAKFGGG